MRSRLAHAARSIVSRETGAHHRALPCRRPVGFADAHDGAETTEIWNQQITVDNRPGAGTIIGTEIGAKAPPDGDTIALVPPATRRIRVSIRNCRTTRWAISRPSRSADSADDHRRASVVRRTFVQGIHRARQSTARRNGFATSGNGTTGHLGGELLKSVARINLVHIPYKGSAPAIADVLGGQVATTFDGLPAALPHVQAGKLNAFAVMSTERSPLLPNVATVAESGYPGYFADSWFGSSCRRKHRPPSSGNSTLTWSRSLKCLRSATA